VDTPALVRPEGLRALDDGALLLADRSRVLIIDPDTGVSRELYRSERKTPMIVSAAFDANGELLVADFDASEIAYLSDPASRFAGLSVEVGRVNSDSFPRVSFDLTVKDRYGRAITGLGSSNFYVSETVVRRESRVEGDIPVEYLASTINPVAGFSFEGGLDVSEEIDMTFMLEASPATASVLVDARDAIGSIYATLGESSSASLVIAGKTAQPAAAGSLAAISAAVLSAVGSDAWRFDSGVRLAAGSLFGSSARRVLVHIGTGSTNDNYLDGPSIAELAALLANNNISLYSVIIGKGRPSDALTYLVDRSGGAVYHADRPEGLSIIAKSVRSGRTGSYRLSFVSSADDVFGTAYLPFSVEVYLRDRSGKDETGYFAPLR
ncbi:MAG: hypothetical protein JXM71_04425, partial [Spirochaetales bacterium]|nr:hypothetical protein [Spirochaetales bacterium]